MCVSSIKVWYEEVLIKRCWFHWQSLLQPWALDTKNELSSNASYNDDVQSDSIQVHYRDPLAKYLYFSKSIPSGEVGAILWDLTKKSQHFYITYRRLKVALISLNTILALLRLEETVRFLVTFSSHRQTEDKGERLFYSQLFWTS